MPKTTEQKLVLSAPEGTKSPQVKIADDGKGIEIILSTEVIIDNFDEVFPIIDPSELIGHTLLNHKPQNRLQEKLLADIHKGIELKLPAFRMPFIDPSEEDGKIVFKPGNNPAIGKIPECWKKIWENFMPSKNSRSATDLHWAALMGKLMKYLVDENNYSVEEAWKAVCDDSRDLGHYLNSKDTKYGFEPTGRRKVGLFYDFANAYKILVSWEDPSCLLLASGCCKCFSYDYPLARVRTVDNARINFELGVRAVGLPVLDV